MRNSVWREHRPRRRGPGAPHEIGSLPPRCVRRRALLLVVPCAPVTPALHSAAPGLRIIVYAAENRRNQYCRRAAQSWSCFADRPNFQLSAAQRDAAAGHISTGDLMAEILHSDITD